MKKILITSLLAGALSIAVSSAYAQSELDALVAAAKKEGAVNSLGMPDNWANWKDTWAQITQTYGLVHQDTDMSSGQEIAKFEAEKSNASGDIGDVGQSFGPIAVRKGVTQAYKPTTWDEIPAWAKDADGHWMVAYSGTISFISNNKLVKNPPKNWGDLLKGNYKVTVGEVGVSAQANSALLAAAIANGGNEKNLQPAYQLFAELAKQGRLSMTDANIANMEKGEVEVALLWDFTSLSYRDKIDPSQFTVSIPTDGSVSAGYSTLINKYAQHPNAAKLAREYIFSDAGQINLARGYARPIRNNVVLPQDVKDKMLSAEQYRNAKPIQDFAAWETTTKAIPRQWQEQVMIYNK
ncbi:MULTISPECIES: ABC transporter substrate-binding protein [unclassified Pseudomonas]|uniref:ABC transporter substrate-binding protein n=1 Tax=unclassified Pseudomonas TaxID=196821 RepID=UPI001CC19AC2|nr:MULTISPECIES: ABC transporter substrate-binding protein [unclassified Pseudomonas]MBI3904347.1 extracellular solute-binding protein [Pseudomonas fluorescens]